MNLWQKIVPATLVALSLSACESPNSIAMKVGVAPESAVKLRALETRRYDTANQTAVLTATTQVLQDLGFTISESVPEVGVLVGSKQRDAEETGQVTGQVALTIMFALLGARYNPDWDKEQTIVVSVVLTPIQNSKQVDVRAAFDRKIVTKNGLHKAELIDEPDIYKQFFSKLSGSIFLEGHEI